MQMTIEQCNQVAREAVHDWLSQNDSAEIKQVIAEWRNLPVEDVDFNETENIWLGQHWMTEDERRRLAVWLRQTGRVEFTDLIADDDLL